MRAICRVPFTAAMLLAAAVLLSSCGPLGPGWLYLPFMEQKKDEGEPPGDTSAPGNVENFTATGRDSEIDLTWLASPYSDYAGVVIRSSQTGAPAKVTEGAEVYRGIDSSYTDTSVVNGTTYYYTAFAYDLSGNYAPGVSASATPRPAPAITQVVPDHGPAGTPVTITGSDFCDTTGIVTFFDGVGGNIASWADTQIDCLVPLGATSGNVTVVTPSGTSNGVYFDVNSPPSVSIMQPSGVQTDEITVNYTLSDSESEDCSIEVLYSPNGGTTWLIATEGSGSDGTAGLATSPSGEFHKFVWDSLADGVGFTAANDQVLLRMTPSDLYQGAGEATSAFTVDNTAFQPPYLASLDPTSGAVDAIVTINGLRFRETQGSSVVTFYDGAAGIPATVTSWSNTQILCKVPAGAATGDVTVTVDGQVSNGIFFTVTAVPAPSITSISPDYGPTGTTATISGSNYGTTQETVTFGGGAVATAFTSWTDTQIICDVPASAVTGNASVTVGGITSNGILFTVDNKPVVAVYDLAPGIYDGEITLTYDLADADGESCDISAKYSPNGGANWYNATLTAASSGTISGNVIQDVAPGTALTFTWNSLVDGVGISGQDDAVRIRITANDGQLTSDPDETSDFSVSNQPDPPSGLAGGANSTSAITWTWVDNSSNETGFEIQDGAHSAKGSVGADVTSWQEGGLSENTQYTRHIHALRSGPPAVYSDPSDDASCYTLVHDAAGGDFALSIGAVLTIGSGTSSQRYPVENEVKYVRCQILLLASEIGQAGTIEKIAFQRAADSTVPVQLENVTIHMTHTSNTTHTLWSDTSTHTLVFPSSGSGPLDIPVGSAGAWFEIQLATPFSYDGTSNLLVSYWCENTSIPEGPLMWRSHLPTNRCIAGRSSTNPAPPVGGIPLPNVQLTIGTVGSVSIFITEPPNPTAGLTAVKIERDSSDSFTAPVLIQDYAATYANADDPGAGKWYYRIRFRNAAGIESAYSSGNSVTVP